jgi:hypothetical protein
MKYYLPGDEEDLALLTILISDKVKVEDSVTALIGWEGIGEVVICLLRLPQFLHHNLLYFLINLEDDESEVPLCLQLLEPQLAVIMHCHSRC